MRCSITPWKILTYLFIGLLICPATSSAQRTDALQTVADVMHTLEGVEAIKNLKGIRASMEEDVADIRSLYNQKRVETVKADRLRQQYITIESGYNYLFDELKRDLLRSLKKADFNRVQNKYSSRAAQLQKDYEGFHHDVANLQSAGNRAVFIPIIIGAVELLIDVIKNKRLDHLALLDAFNTISPQFTQQFYMKDWEELWPEYVAQNGHSTARVYGGGQLISAPYTTGSANADIELYLGDPGTASLVKQSMISGERVGNIQKLRSQLAYHPGDKFAITVHSQQFIYFFALDNETQQLQLLYPQRTRNTSLSNDGYNIAFDSVVRLPASGTYVIDRKGASEKWLVVVSQSQLYDADAFAAQYVHVTPGQRNTVISTDKAFDAKSIHDASSNIRYSASDVLKVYEIDLQKAL